MMQCAEGISSVFFRGMDGAPGIIELNDHLKDLLRSFFTRNLQTNAKTVWSMV